MVNFVVVYGSTTLTNISSFIYEEADTGMVVHAVNESKKDSFTFMVKLLLTAIY